MLMATACAHEAKVQAVRADESGERWAAWARRFEALPRCLPGELEAAPAAEAGPLALGQTVHLRARLGLIDTSCDEFLREGLAGRRLPDHSVKSLAELDDAVGRSERDICASSLGVRTAEAQLLVETEVSWEGVWKEYDAERFDALLRQTDALVIGVVDAVYGGPVGAVRGARVRVRVDRLCRGPGPPLVRERLVDTSQQRWKLLDGLEHLAQMPTVSALRREQALRVLFDASICVERPRAQWAAERLAEDSGDRSKLEFLSWLPPCPP